MNQKYVYKKNHLKFFANLLDGVGYRFKKPPSSKTINPKKILVVRLDQLGDIVQTFPVLSSLRSSYPSAIIHMLTTKVGSELVQYAKLADDVFTWECPWFDASRNPTQSIRDVIGLIKNNDYDCVFELRGDIRLIYMLKRARVKNLVGNGSTGGGFLLDVQVPWNANDHAIDKNLSYVEAIGGTLSVTDPVFPRKEFAGGKTYRLVIHPDAGTKAKKWPLLNFVDLINKLLEWPNLEIHLVGLNQALGVEIEKKSNKKISNHMGSTNLRQLLEILETSDGLLTNDSGPAHLMSAYQKPVWILWSGTAEESVWAPRGTNIHVFKNRTDCTPCSLAECIVGGHPCLAKIQVNDVLEKLKKDIPIARTLV